MSVTTTEAVPVAQPLDIALLLDRATNMAHLGHEDLAQAVPALPDDVPLWIAVDLVCAERHLRAAATLIDKAAEQLEATR